MHEAGVELAVQQGIDLLLRIQLGQGHLDARIAGLERPQVLGQATVQHRADEAHAQPPHRAGDLARASRRASSAWASKAVADSRKARPAAVRRTPRLSRSNSARRPKPPAAGC